MYACVVDLEHLSLPTIDYPKRSPGMMMLVLFVTIQGPATMYFVFGSCQDIATVLIGHKDVPITIWAYVVAQLALKPWTRSWCTT